VTFAPSLLIDLLMFSVAGLHQHRAERARNPVEICFTRSETELIASVEKPALPLAYSTTGSGAS
jgi:hypothetical protein